MTDKYFYLTSSLPYLFFGEKPYFTKNSFLEECKKWADPEDMERLQNLDINDFIISKADTEEVRQWKRFDYAFKKELAEVRKNKKTGSQETLAPKYKNIFSQENPLLIEKAFEKLRWDYLDEVEQGHHFDIDKLQIYYLKLQISERLSSFDREKGEKVFEQACEIESISA